RKRSRALNGRLNRWSFRKLQSTIEYKAKLAGLNIMLKLRARRACAQDAGLSPGGYRLMRCPECGLEGDRDKIAVLNLLQEYQRNVPASTVHGESLPMTRGGKNEERNAS
ncbi:MAG: zinc ribbon domain-containing protein, partial [Candidatus Methanomethylicaceae archaeon]